MVLTATDHGDNVPTRANGGVRQVPGAAKIFSRARKRFKWCAEWESNFRPRFIEDVKFANGDSDNGYQWPNEIRRNRDIDQRPCLTMNLIRQHNLNISNEARKNKASPKVIGTGAGASAASADAMRDIFRHVEVISKAQDAYTIARSWQIDGGIGWWRVITDYARPDTFDQEMYVRPVNDPLSIYMDPDIQQKDGSDARFALVFDDVPRDEWDEAYPHLAGMFVNTSPLGTGTDAEDWINRDYIRVCEYFEKVKVPDRVISFMYQGQRKEILESLLPANAVAGLLAQKLTRTRPTMTDRIDWYLIVGEAVVDTTIWPGKYIPLVRCVGEEFVIEGIMDRKGHTRNQKDAQRMFNYNASAQVEFVALQSKTPWLAASAAIEGYETMWNSANVVNHSVLVYNAFDDDGNQMPPPQRQDPPTASPAFQTGMDTAFNQIMMVSGQWQNQMGMLGNERTGAAINARQDQSATAVFHFQDNYETALRFTAMIMIDLIPKIYDTKRIISILADDETTYDLEIDPSAKQAFAQQQAANGEVVRRVLNPKIGYYDIAPSVGPAYATKREEGRDGLALVLTQSKELTPIIGDLLLSAMDFEGAQEAARRLKRMVPPQALGKGPTQNEQQLTTMVQGLQNALATALQKLGKSELKLVGKEQMRDIDAYKANTDRLLAIADFLPTQPQDLATLVRDTVLEALKTDLTPIVEANANNIDIDGPGGSGARPAEPPTGADDSEVMPRGARKAPDGNWYVEDPSRDGGYLRVERR